MSLFNTFKCAECGKTIYVRLPKEYVYKRSARGSGTAWLCSWHCLQAFDNHRNERRRGKITNQEKEVMFEMMQAGKSCQDIATALGISRRSVTNWRERWIDTGVLDG